MKSQRVARQCVVQVGCFSRWETSDRAAWLGSTRNVAAADFMRFIEGERGTASWAAYRRCFRRFQEGNLGLACSYTKS